MIMANEPSDKEMHDWLRQTLHEYLPKGDPQADWGKLLPKTKRKPFFLWWFLGIILLLCGLGSWLYFNDKIADNEIVTPLKKLNYSSTLNDKTVLKIYRNLPKKETIETHNKAENLLKSIPLKVVDDRGTIRIIPTFLMPKSFVLPTLIFPKSELKIAQLNAEANEIKYQLLTGNFGDDSTTYQALDRNIILWSNSVIVADFTTSMFPYSTQVFAWMNKNRRNGAIKGTIFFTDCDNLGVQTQANGNAGQMFITKEKNPEKVLKIMIEAAQNTLKNEDFEENDVEALLYAQNNFPEVKHLVLIADNHAAPKDMYLLPKLKKPVHVMLCGNTGDSSLAFHPEYLEIATQTNGSIHTLEDDLNSEDLDDKTVIKVGQKYYRYIPRKQHFKLTNFKNRPTRVLGFIWL